jgi:hypothetical protein
MLVLPMTPPGRGQIPPVSLDELDYLTDLQRHESLSRGELKARLVPRSGAADLSLIDADQGDCGVAALLTMNLGQRRPWATLAA